MKITPYLLFNGQCKEAFNFYETTLNGNITFMQTHGDSPMENEVPAAWHEKIMHASMTIGEQELMGSDAPPEHYHIPQGAYTSLEVNSIAEAERIYHALAEKGCVHMALAETFWAERFAMLADQFGTLWMVNYPKPQ